MKRTLLISMAFVVAVVAVAQARTRLLAPMSGTGKGKAKFDQRSNEAQFEFEAERLPRNAAFKLNAGNLPTVTLASDGFGRIVFTKRWGRTGQPTIGVGTTATLKNASGAVVLTGTFAPR